MPRRLNAHLRCRRCRLHESLCVCALLPRVATATRVLLYVHRTDARKPSNTGMLAAACLPNSEVVVRGGADAPSHADGGVGASSLVDAAVLLFPHEDAMPFDAYLEAHAAAKPTTLVVPDGSWRQASKVRKRVPGLDALPCVRLTSSEPSAYRLRTEAHEGRLSTIEAIARALALLEGPHVRDALDAALRMLVDRTLWSRGDLATDDVLGGVPAGVMRHEPRAPRLR